MTRTRKTKYSVAVTEYMQSAGHATNAEILLQMRRVYPELSATTIHRITSGMVRRKELALAPPGAGVAMRLDANTSSHDHFECTDCGCLRDINLPDSLLNQLRQILGDCQFSGNLNIQGICKECLENKEE